MNIRVTPDKQPFLLCHGFQKITVQPGRCMAKRSLLEIADLLRNLQIRSYHADFFSVIVDNFRSMRTENTLRMSSESINLQLKLPIVCPIIITLGNDKKFTVDHPIRRSDIPRHTEIFLPYHRFYVSIPRSILPDDIARAVSRSIVNDENIEIKIGFLAQYAVKAPTQDILVVVRRHQHRNRSSHLIISFTAVAISRTSSNPRA